MSSPTLVLVTGASGFIGSHVVAQLLDSGYRVRGTARGSKLDTLRGAFKTNPNFEAIEITDIVHGDFTAALEGAGAVIHLASPLAGKQSPEDALNSAIEGTLNLLRQANQAGVHKIVLTSSWATTLDPSLAATFAGVTFTEKDWGHTSREELLKGESNPLSTYCGTKILAELAAWKFAKEHPELDLATINPPFVFGAPLPELESALNGITALGSNALIYQLIAGEAGRPLPPQVPPFYCHVRDVAKAHVAALRLSKLPAGKDVQDKRFIVAGPGAILFADAVKYLEGARPEIKGRLPTLENAPPLPGTLSKIDTTRAAEVLGVHECIGWQETLSETVDALLKAEKTWN